MRRDRKWPARHARSRSRRLPVTTGHGSPHHPTMIAPAPAPPPARPLDLGAVLRSLRGSAGRIIHGCRDLRRHLRPCRPADRTGPLCDTATSPTSQRGPTPHRPARMTAWQRPRHAPPHRHRRPHALARPRYTDQAPRTWPVDLDRQLWNADGAAPWTPAVWCGPGPSRHHLSRHRSAGHLLLRCSRGSDSATWPKPGCRPPLPRVCRWRRSARDGHDKGRIPP